MGNKKMIRKDLSGRVLACTSFVATLTMNRPGWLTLFADRLGHKIAIVIGIGIGIGIIMTIIGIILAIFIIMIVSLSLLWVLKTLSKLETGGDSTCFAADLSFLCRYSRNCMKTCCVVWWYDEHHIFNSKSYNHFHFLSWSAPFSFSSKLIHNTTPYYRRISVQWMGPSDKGLFVTGPSKHSIDLSNINL